MNTTLLENISTGEYNSNPAKLKTHAISASTRRLNQVTATIICGHKKTIRRCWVAFAHEVISARPGQYSAPGNRRTLILYQAWCLVWRIYTAKRTASTNNPLSLAHDLDVIARSAPADLPCSLDRLDFERLCLDALHLARQRGEHV